jgi:hypothetical protein
VPVTCGTRASNDSTAPWPNATTTSGELPSASCARTLTRTAVWRNATPHAGEVVELHGRLIAAAVGATGIRDLGLLESALAQPAATFCLAQAGQLPFRFAGPVGFIGADGFASVERESITSESFQSSSEVSLRKLANSAEPSSRIKTASAFA